MKEKHHIEGAGEDQIIQEEEVKYTQGQVQAIIANKAWKDAEFRQKVLENPRKALKDYFEIEFSPDLQIIAQEAPMPNQVYFVVPRHHKETVGIELTEGQLDAVAGGTLGTLYSVAEGSYPESGGMQVASGTSNSSMDSFTQDFQKFTSILGVLGQTIGGLSGMFKK